ncbi:response regulator transcription factor [Burkholderia sp. R-69980]|nr:response regulator transcription factor [Burkholderia sp. R-69980]
MIKVGIADAHPATRAGIRLALESVNRFEIVGEASDGSGTLSLLRSSKPQVLTLGLRMPGIHGLELIRLVKSENPAVRILVLTMWSEQTYAVQAFRAGASGFLTKASSAAQLVEAVSKVASGGIYVSIATAEQLAQHLGEEKGSLPHQRLSQREFDVFMRLVSGQSVADIAEALRVSSKTVSTQRTRILEKMELPHEAALVRYAVSHGLIEDDDI